ncbi:MAG: DUF2169 domain-containing protein [Saccharospirillum sp.]
MNVIKSLHSGVIHRTTEVFEHQLFTLSSLWAFELTTGEPVLEQALWQTVAKAIAEGEVFDAGYAKVKSEFLLAGQFLSAQPVPAGQVQVRLGDREKTLDVFGDRYWSAGGFSGPDPMTAMPLRYEYAFGGKGDDRNPVGKGLETVQVDGRERRPLPNVEYHQHIMTGPSDRPPPAAFGRIDNVWPVRQALAGTYDQEYIEERMPGFPDDLDPLYFNDAATDQQFDGFLAGTEAYRLTQVNLTHPVIEGRLPGVRARLFVEVENDTGVQFQELASVLDTVWFFPNDNLGVLIHRGSLAVQTRTASEIRKVLIAHEWLEDEPRSADHYEDQLTKRSDPERGYLYMLNTADLIPEGVTCGIERLQAQSDLPFEGHAQAAMQSYIDKQVSSAKAQAKAQLEAAVVDAPSDLDAPSLDDLMNPAATPTEEQQRIEAYLEQIMPGYAGEGGLDFTRMDLAAIDELQAYIAQLTADSEEKVLRAMRERLNELRTDNADSAMADELEAALARRHEPPALPRIARAIDEQMEALRTQMEAAQREAMVLQSMGMEPSQTHRDLLDMEALEKNLTVSKAEAEKSYRLGAHRIERAASPHPEEEPDLPGDFHRRMAQPEGLVAWDGAFADLTGVAVDRLNLSRAYLEHTHVQSSNWRDCDFSEAVWVHANLRNARFERCRFEEANLGGSVFEGAVFVDCDFQGAGFGGADLSHAQFERCRFADKMDAFLECRLVGTRFADCSFALAQFYQLDMTGCQFEQSVLDESNVFECQLGQSVFVECSMKAVNIVQSDLSGARLERCDVHNIRFVNGCRLPQASFEASYGELVNFRDCDLDQACFNQARFAQSDFSGAQLTRASFEQAYVRGSLFINANLERANLMKADAMEASFQEARLTGTRFNGANLYGANFYSVIVGETDFRDANLKKTLFKDWRPGRE